MELVDFVRLRWKVLALLLLLGLVAIAIVGQGTGGGDYTARAQLLVQPPSNQQSTYGNDPDRYVVTEMRLLYDDDIIDKAAQEGGVTRTRLARSLSFQHNSGSELVTLAVSDASRSRAVELVNDVAEAYLDNAKSRAFASFDSTKKTLAADIKDTNGQLSDVQTQEQKYVDEFNAANPDRVGAGQTAVPSSLSTKAQLLQTRLQQLTIAQFQATVLQAPQARSRVLRPASGASQPAGWGPTTYLAGFVGWALVLLALAGVAVVLSRRVLGATRWNNATRELALGRAVDLHRPPFTPRKQGLNRIANALRKQAGPTGQVLLSSFPESTPALTKAHDLVAQRMASSELDLVRVDSLPEAVEMLDHDRPGQPIVMLVDVALCSVDDVESFGDYPVDVQRRIVPVLV